MTDQKQYRTTWVEPGRSSRHSYHRTLELAWRRAEANYPRSHDGEAWSVVAKRDGANWVESTGEVNDGD
jgi:hypothetical protein